MPTDLDQRIRRVVVEIVDTAPPPTAFGEVRVAEPPRRPTRRIVTIAVAAVTVLALALGTAWFVRDEHNRAIAPARPGIATIPLQDVPEGVSPRTPEGNPLFLVRSGKAVTALWARDSQRPHKSLWWCVDEQVFVSWGGWAYDREGHSIVPPGAGLDRAPTTVRRGVVHIDLRTRIADPTPPPERPFDTGIPCERRVISAQQIDILTLTNGHYDAREIRTSAGIKTIRFHTTATLHALALTHADRRVFTTFSTGRPVFGRVELKPGRYEIACTIPGHRAAGEHATIVVTPK